MVKISPKVPQVQKSKIATRKPPKIAQILPTDGLNNDLLDISFSEMVNLGRHLAEGGDWGS